MPHLTLEYSDNLPAPVDWTGVMAAVHAALDGLGLFRLEEVKSRTIGWRDTLIGDGKRSQSFVHLTVAILTGRSEEIRQRISQRCLDSLRDQLAPIGQRRSLDVTVEIREMDRGSYGKWVSTPGR